MKQNHFPNRNALENLSKIDDQEIMEAIMKKWTFVAFLVPALAAIGFAGETKTKDQAVALVQEAVKFGKANGIEKLIQEINFEHGSLHIKGPNDVYLIVYGPDGKVIAHGADPKHLRMDHLNYKELKDMTDKNKKGWHEYMVPNSIKGRSANWGVAYEVLDKDLITSTISVP